MSTFNSLYCLCVFIYNNDLRITKNFNIFTFPKTISSLRLYHTMAISRKISSMYNNILLRSSMANNLQFIIVIVKNQRICLFLRLFLYRRRTIGYTIHTFEITGVYFYTLANRAKLCLINLLSPNKSKNIITNKIMVWFKSVNQFRYNYVFL